MSDAPEVLPAAGRASERSARPKRHRGDGEIFQVGTIWYCRYSVKGKRHKESAKSHRRMDAVRLLNRRRAEISGGTFAPDAERVTFEYLVGLVKSDYTRKHRRSLDRLERAVVHLAAEFAGARAVDIDPARLDAYWDKRRSEKRNDKPTADATISYELAALKRGFRLAVGLGKLHRVPKFPEIRISNARMGLVSEAEFAAIMEQLHNRAYVAPLTFAYLTAWRLASEVLTLQWRNVDLVAGVVKLDANTVTKNAEARTLPTRAMPEIHALLVSQREFVSALERDNNIVCPLVFPRLNGAPIKSLRGAWDAAAERAGLKGKLLHDLRRSAATRFTAAGVSRGVAMAIGGWKTEEVFRRYNITETSDIVAGLEKVAEHRAAASKARVSHAIRPRSGPKAERMARKA
jgi:integrase